jgi:hypothetical protein
MSVGIVVAIALVTGIAIGVGAIYAVQNRRIRKLQERFGKEYERVLEETGNRSAAEIKLRHRQRRIQKLDVHSLDDGERTRFQDEWRDIQAQFVDNPSLALTEADRLVGEVMAAEGYPMREFAGRTAGISVDHPAVCEEYREGHDIATRNVQGRATTEDLRKAMIHYRTLFEELVSANGHTHRERTRS